METPAVTSDTALKITKPRVSTKSLPGDPLTPGKHIRKAKAKPLPVFKIEHTPTVIVFK